MLFRLNIFKNNFDLLLLAVMFFHHFLTNYKYTFDLYNLVKLIEEFGPLKSLTKLL